MQRVPDSEKSGRRHSSTIIVSRITQVKTGVIINKSDVRVDTYRASGNGGQHRNKTDSAIRLTHLPTGIMVTATEDRSQGINRKVAWERLRSRLQGLASDSDHEVTNQSRRASEGQQTAYTWTQWRDEVKFPGGRANMSKVLAGKLDKLL